MALPELPSGGKANPGAYYPGGTTWVNPGVGGNSYTPSILITNDSFDYDSRLQSLQKNFENHAAWLISYHASEMGITRSQASILSEIQAFKPFTTVISDLFSVINTAYESRNGYAYRLPASQIGDSIKNAFEGFIYSVELFSAYLLGRNFSYDVSDVSFTLENVGFKPGGLLTSYRTTAFSYERSVLGPDSAYSPTEGNDLIYIGKPTEVPIYTGAGNDLVVFGYGGHLVVDEAGSDFYRFSAGENVLVYAMDVQDKIISRDSFGSVLVRDIMSGDVDTVSGLNRMHFANGVVAFDTGAGEVAGSAYRLYQAAFDRVPDREGLGYWIGRMDVGVELKAVAESFLAAPEFTRIYGTQQSVSNAKYVELLYTNTLGRNYDQGGFNYWVGKLDSGQTTRGDLLAFFSESNENQARVAGAIEDGIWYVM